MKKWILTLLCALAFSLPAHAAVYTNGIDAANPPFTYIDENSGKPTGFDVEAIDWIAKTMGFEVKHVPIAWDAIIPNLLGHKIDMICSGMTITPERARLVAFSNPYWTMYNVFIVKQDSPLTVASILTEKIRIGGQRGASETIVLAKARKDLQLRYEMHLYDTVPQLVDAVVNDHIQAALMDSQAAQEAISRGKAIKIAGKHGKPVSFGVAFRADDEELRTLVNAGFEKLMADPFWNGLQLKYHLTPEN